MWQKIFQIGEELKLPMKGFANMHANLSLNALMLAAAKEIGFLAPGVDALFERQAMARQIPIHGLESLDDQYELLFGPPMPFSQKELDGFVKGVQEELVKLADAWKHGRDDVMQAMLNNAEEQMGIHWNVLAKNRGRNLKMCRNFKNLNEESFPLFVVVGALHLVGQDSLLNLLRNEGYTVKRLRPNEDFY